MSARPKSLIFLLCALLLGGAQRPAPPLESLPPAYVDSLAHELALYGRDEWSSSSVHLMLLLRRFHNERRRAPSFEAAAYQARAAAELRSDHPEDAYFDAHRAIVLHRAIGYTRAYAGDLLTQAQAEYCLGGYQDALEDIARAQSLLRAQRDTQPVTALATFMTGQIELAAGDTVGAQRAFTRAASASHGFLYATAHAYVDLARGQYENSRAAYQLIPQLAQNKARALLARADAEFSKAAQSAPKEPPPPANENPCGTPGRPRVCADVFFIQDVTRQGWDDPKWLLADELLGRAQAMAAAGDSQHARVEIELARRESEKAGQADTRLDAAVNSLQTLLNAQEDRAMFRGDPGFFLDDISPKLWQAYYDFARLFAAIDLPAKALQTYDTATGSIGFLREGLAPSRREQFLEQHLTVYDDYIELLLRTPGGDRRAFDVLQERTARQTIDAMRAKQLQSILRDSSNAARRAAQLAAQANLNAWRIAMLQDAFSGTQSKSDLAALQRSQDALERRYATLRERLRTSPNAADRRYYVWSANASQPLHTAHEIVTTVLRPGETMLVYAWLPHEIAVWTLSYNHYGGVRIVPRTAQLERDLGDAFISDIDIVDNLSPQQAAKSVGDFQEHSAAVYRALIAGSPVPPKDDLIIVPSGPLYQVAFEALVTGERTPKCAVSYLICTHAVSYAASPETLAIARESLTPVASRSLLAFARPAIGQRKTPIPPRTPQRIALRGCSGESTLATLPDLTETQKEATQSAAAFPGAPIRLNLGESASYRTLMSLNDRSELARYRYVLFATHALLPNDCAVTEPSIVFSHPEVPAAHGLITVDDVSHLQLRAQVVLLSACSTGAYLTPDARPLGDGISQMTRAFLFAGSRSVGVTLWDVYDPAGPQLVPPFFTAIGKDRLSPTRALQRAKIAMINSPMRHPFFWAPTVLYGDAR